MHIFKLSNFFYTAVIDRNVTVIYSCEPGVRTARIFDGLVMMIARAISLMLCGVEYFADDNAAFKLVYYGHTWI